MSSDVPILGNALVSPGIQTYAQNVESYISRLDADAVRECDSIIVKVSSAVAEEFATGENCRDLRRQVSERVKGRPIHLLTYDGASQHVIYNVQEHTLVRIDDASAIDRARQFDLARILRLRGSRGFLSLPPNHHFITPSGIHATRFLRVADLMQDISGLDLFAYWLKPHIVNSGGVLADNWGITSVVLRTLLSVNNAQSIPFDFLPGHVIHEPAAANRIVGRLATQVQTPQKLLCVISVHSSGRYVTRLREFFATSGLENLFEPISLVRFADADKSIRTLYELPFDSGQTGEDGNCELCKKQSLAIAVDPRLYYVRESQERSLLLGTKHYNAREFLTRYGATPGVLNIHHTDPHDGRHHAYYVDIKSLIPIGAFRSRLEKILSEIPKPDLICVPNHDAGKAFALLVSSIFQVPWISDDNEFRPTHTTHGNQIESVRNAKNLLILDDVVISGTRLEKINRAFRESASQYNSFQSITYLVALARMESPEAWGRLKNALTQKHHWAARLEAVETIHLPFWKKDSCPWCLEESALRQVSQQLASPPIWVTDRLLSLQSARQRLGASPLLTLPGVNTPTLGDQSPLLGSGASALEVVFAIATAVQGMRCHRDQNEQLGEDYLVRRVFSVENLRRYSEGLLRAIFLRTIRPPEWGQENRGKTSKFLTEISSANDQQILLGELALAIYKGSISYTDTSWLVDQLPDEAKTVVKILLAI